MTFRVRLLVVLLLAVAVPLGVLTWLVRKETSLRLTAQYERRVAGAVASIETDIARERDALHAALRTVSAALAADNRVRRAVVDGAADERRYLLDYAARAMTLAGLDMLQLHDDSGRIVSSGHFRNDYDRIDNALPRALASAPGHAALVTTRTADATLLVLAAVEQADIGGRRLAIVGGVDANARLARRGVPGDDVTVEIVTAVADTAAPASRNAIVRVLPLAAVTADGRVTPASIRVSHSTAPLRELLASVDRRFALVTLLTLAAAAALAMWLAARMSRPLTALAATAADVDLDRLDVDFGPPRRDEIGVLARSMRAMTDRLRQSALALKEAERRATVGEIARQVNHDLKNGLTPIRNVMRHLTRQADDDPAALVTVFGERRASLEASIEYLENLATSYARLSPPAQWRACDMNEIVRGVAAGLRGTERVQIETSLADRAVVTADPVALRRIVENLVDNAMDSLDETGGRVTLSTEAASTEHGARVRIAVTDTGRGMNDSEIERVFEDFYTTKADGRGLGLSIVRRLVMDLGGSIRVDSHVGEGSRFTVDLPAQAGPGAAAPTRVED